MKTLCVAEAKVCCPRGYLCPMPQRLQLVFNPKQAADEDLVRMQFLHKAGLPMGEVLRVKESIDSRSRYPKVIISADVYASHEKVQLEEGFRLQNVSAAPEVHIIGAGPAGLYAALALIEQGFKPVILERGKDVKRRRRDLAQLNRTGQVDPNSNYCFGEGGAGTYSDGKLYTRSTKRGPVSKVLRSLIEHGAPESIQWLAHPHIGTNKLPQLVESLRQSIIAAGGEVRFDSQVVDLDVAFGKIVSLSLSGRYSVPVQQVILATGHSARDIFELLHRKQIAIEAKPFALGVRLEHSQETIDQIQYKCDLRGPYLPPSSYSLVEQVNGRGVFSFCMCPGGIIAPAATAPGEIVVNGWSPSKRNNPYANSGFVVSVDEKDFAPYASQGPLSGLAYQTQVEQACFQLTGSIQAPAQRMEDFIQQKRSADLPLNSYIPGLQSHDLNQVLPAAIHERIRAALVQLGQKMPAFRTNHAILVAVESRTSSPVRIPRDAEKLSHPGIENLYPCGEGAGYAGGIMSAALDGIRVAGAVCSSLA